MRPREDGGEMGSGWTDGDTLNGNCGCQFYIVRRTVPWKLFYSDRYLMKELVGIYLTKIGGEMSGVAKKKHGY